MQSKSFVLDALLIGFRSTDAKLRGAGLVQIDEHHRKQLSTKRLDRIWRLLYTVRMIHEHKFNSQRRKMHNNLLLEELFEVSTTLNDVEFEVIRGFTSYPVDGLKEWCKYALVGKNGTGSC